MNENYLWDKRGEPDAEVEQLEALLSRYRSVAPMPDFKCVAVIRRRPIWPFAIAATLIVCAILGALRLYTPANRWRATESSGIADVPHLILRAGDVVRTERGSVRLQSPAVGTIDLGANTTVRLIENRSRRHRLALAAGTIHAKTTSQPGVFVIDTPKARAIDLGCEYTLTIAPGGGGELHVIFGWVDLTHGYEQSLVPQGASASIESDGSLTVPVFDDAVPAFHAAIRNHDMPAIVANARTRDAFTLLNLFRLATPDERGILYDRLNQFVPAPASITRESVRYWTPSSTELWWTPVLRASGIQALKKPKR
ncbi:MAG TPA: FecR domain-containing protein [Thermoanaerobaculia bacterium]|jgi:ferric-dicitrate binding protein FerR (iron transport regulator)|nr:FecR domain-containing protein [Thermoanaerobaculia bacterium]